MTKTKAKKYLSAITKNKKKYCTCEVLAKSIGIYPDKIAEELSLFNPMLRMDASFNLKEIIPEIEAYIASLEANTVKKVKTPKDKKVPLEKFASIQDFFYKKMTANGLIDRYAKLNENDLKALQLLVKKELIKVKKSK